MRLLAGNVPEQRQSARIDLPLGDGFMQSTAGFMRVAAVMKTTLAEILGEFHKALFYSAKAQMMQTKCLYAGAVYKITV